MTVHALTDKALRELYEHVRKPVLPRGSGPEFYRQSVGQMVRRIGMLVDRDSKGEDISYCLRTVAAIAYLCAERFGRERRVGGHVPYDIAKERKRQNQKWGRSPGSWNVSTSHKINVLVEEVGEVAKALQEFDEYDPESDPRSVYDELIQVAAVCVQWLESMGVKR